MRFAQCAMRYRVGSRPPEASRAPAHLRTRAPAHPRTRAPPHRAKRTARDIFASHALPPLTVSTLVNCAFCGRENEASSRFCIDCGKPMTASAGRLRGATTTGTTGTSAPIAAALAGAASSAAQPADVSPIAAALSGLTGLCPRCDRAVDPNLPYCGHCGARIDASGETGHCESCGALYQVGVDLFCARCGNRVGAAADDAGAGSAAPGRKRLSGPKLSVLNDEGLPYSSVTLDRTGSVVGRGDADIRFDDVYLSPLHARFELRDGELWVRDLGSRNGTWCYLDGPTRLSDGDVMLIGSQVLRFRRLGYPGPHPRDSDATRRMGSMVPSADVAVLEQLRADGSVRDSCHLSPARTVLVGRESGDWVFPYDPTMSGRHAEIRSEDAEFFVHDAGSRNGVALAVHGDRQLKPGQRVLVGDQILRVESI
jgi:pSer/pThr/pTyr-binding forkhead associated (FHA) protein